MTIVTCLSSTRNVGPILVAIFVAFELVIFWKLFTETTKYNNFQDGKKPFQKIRVFEEKPIASFRNLLSFDYFNNQRGYTNWCNYSAEDLEKLKGLGDKHEQHGYKSFSMYIIDKAFPIFEQAMNDELSSINETHDTPVWDLENYKMFMAMSFCQMADHYDCSLDEDTPNGKIDHLLTPSEDNQESTLAFVLNYGLANSTYELRQEARKGLKNMIKNGIGLDLREHVPEVDTMYRLFISFHGPKGALEVDGPTKLRLIVTTKTPVRRRSTVSTSSHAPIIL